MISENQQPKSLQRIYNVFSKNEKKNFLEAFFLCRISINEYLFTQGKPAEAVYFLEEGYMVLEKTHKGKQHLISFVTPGRFVGLLNAIDSSVSEVSLRSLSDGIVFGIKLAEFEQLIRTNGEFAYTIHRMLVKSGLRLLHRYLEIKNKSAKCMVVEFLLYLYNDIFQTLTFDFPLTRTDIGSFTNLTGRKVIEIMGQLTNDKLISETKTQLTILDLDGLKKIILE